jgi:hypothetical protein
MSTQNITADQIARWLARPAWDAADSLVPGFLRDYIEEPEGSTARTQAWREIESRFRTLSAPEAQAFVEDYDLRMAALARYATIRRVSPQQTRAALVDAGVDPADIKASNNADWTLVVTHRGRPRGVWRALDGTWVVGDPRGSTIAQQFSGRHIMKLLDLGLPPRDDL